MKQPQWALVQYTLRGMDGVHVGVEARGVVRRAPAHWPYRVMDLLEEWSRWAPELRELDVEAMDVVADASLVAPLTFPRKVICAGANYYDHAEEMGTAKPDSSASPYFFLKPPTTTVVGPHVDVVIPSVPNVNVDWEAELGVVIADRCKDVPVAEARAHVAGYVVANDISARGVFHRPDAVFPAFGFDWFAHKAQDGFCPIGPGIVPEWHIADPQSLAITLSINGATKQDSNTSNMVIGVDELVAAASRTVTLEPGDVILTGTPAGVGMPRQEFLRPDDVMVIEIDGVGRLENRMVEA